MTKELDPTQFIYELPPVSERQLETIKVVAKYTVLQPEIIQARKSEFDFLNPDHKLHSLYKVFVKQYELVNGPVSVNKDVFARVLERAKEIEKEKELKANEIGAESSDENKPIDANSSEAEPPSLVDWSNFVVLETIEFFTADLNGKSSLPPPIDKEDVTSHRYQTNRKRYNAPVVPPDTQETYFKSPYTGELVPAKDYDEHMKVHEFDPLRQTQRSKEIAREETTNLDNDMATDNLEKLLAKRRKFLESDSY